MYVCSIVKPFKLYMYTFVHNKLASRNYLIVLVYMHIYTCTCTVPGCTIGFNSFIPIHVRVSNDTIMFTSEMFTCSMPLQTCSVVNLIYRNVVLINIA